MARKGDGVVATTAAAATAAPTTARGGLSVAAAAAAAEPVAGQQQRLGIRSRLRAQPILPPAAGPWSRSAWSLGSASQHIDYGRPTMHRMRARIACAQLCIARHASQPYASHRMQREQRAAAARTHRSSPHACTRLREERMKLSLQTVVCTHELLHYATLQMLSSTWRCGRRPTRARALCRGSLGSGAHWYSGTTEHQVRCRS